MRFLEIVEPLLVPWCKSSMIRAASLRGERGVGGATDGEKRTDLGMVSVFVAGAALGVVSLRR